MAAARTPQMRFGDLALFLVCAIILGIFFGLSQLLPVVNSSPVSWLFVAGRTVFGLPFVLYIPGYLLQGLFFPFCADLDSIERIGLSLGLSVAIVTLLALVLNVLPWGLSSMAIVMGQGGLIFLLILMTVFVRWYKHAQKVYIPEVRPNLSRWWSSLGINEQRMMIILAGAVTLAIITTAWIFLTPSSNTQMTEFYILGSEGLAENYPREITSGQVVTVTTGITNREGTNSIYYIRIKLDNQVIGQTGPINLENSASWEKPVDFTVPKVGDDQLVMFILERDGQPSPYRTLRLWINVKPAEAP